MTKQEHDLMLALFVTQMKVCQTIWELLKTRGVADSGDAGPFSALALANMRGDAGILFQTYVELARKSRVVLPADFFPNV